MPQVVQAFVNGKDFGKADFVKQQIITLYKNDMQEQNEENSVYVMLGAVVGCHKTT